jgi:hypothetical protein
MTYWWLILGMAAITFLMRYSLFAWPNLRFPPLVRQGLQYVPTAVLTAIVLLAGGGSRDRYRSAEPQPSGNHRGRLGGVLFAALGDGADCLTESLPGRALSPPWRSPAPGH